MFSIEIDSDIHYDGTTIYFVSLRYAGDGLDFCYRPSDAENFYLESERCGESGDFIGSVESPTDKMSWDSEKVTFSIDFNSNGGGEMFVVLRRDPSFDSAMEEWDRAVNM